MSREIKFRAWNVVFYNKFLYSKEGNLNSFFHAVEQRPESERLLQQYTGLRDKNGKEIYEGDIVRHDGGRLGEVKYDEANYSFQMNISSAVLDQEVGGSGENMEIIGNIYENPELLAKAEQEN